MKYLRLLTLLLISVACTCGRAQNMLENGRFEMLRSGEPIGLIMPCCLTGTASCVTNLNATVRNTAKMNQLEKRNFARWRIGN